MNKVFEKILERLEEAKGNVPVNRLLDNIIKEKPKELGQLIAYDKAIEIVKQEAEKYNGCWIPVEEELPKDGDKRYYMCIVENHEEDPPMYCQYDEECGFGFYQDIYDEHTLGFVDCEFNTNEEFGYEKVIAWQQLLTYHPKGE